MTREEFMDIVYHELHSDGDNCRANRIIDAADEYAEEQAGWIPVSERLPEECDNYFVTKTTRKAELEKGYKPHIRSCVESYTQKSHWGKSTCGVTAWMPLPKPYEAESEGQ